VEIYCSGRGLVSWVEHYGLECAPTLEAIKASKDEKAPLILQNFYHALSHAVSTAVTLFNPSHLVLGGSVVVNNSGLEEFVRENVEGYAFPSAAKDAKIVVTTLQNGCLEGTKWL
jgi:predicted NBD/HSP70 family sugar kinase